MTKEKFDLKEILKKWFADSKTIAVAGIGNPIRSDDFVGVKIVQDLQGQVPESVHLIECETVPESFMHEIIDIKPSHILLIDAALLGLKPAEIRLVFPEHVTDFPAVTTHQLPLRVFCEYITKMTGAKIALLLIEPKNVAFGEGLTPKVQEIAEKISKILRELVRD